MSIVRSPVRSVVRSPVRGVFGGSASLADEATSYLNGIVPYHWFDFINDRCLYASNDVGGVSGATGYSFARASQGYYTNADGTLTSFASGALRRGDRGVLIEGARTNLLLRSQEIDNASWTKGGGSVSANATTAPDGTSTADLFTEDTSTGDHRTFQSVTLTAAAHTFSVYLKPNGRTLVTVTFAAVGEVTFDISAGTVTSTVLGTGAISAAANGWYRCELRFTATAISYNAQIRLVSTGTTTSYTGNGTSGVYVWGAQVEAASTSSSYIPTTTASATRAADVLTCTAGVSYPASLWAQYERAVDTGANESIVYVDDGSTNNFTRIIVSNADVLVASMNSGGVAQGSSTSAATISAGSTIKGSARFNTNSIRACLSGTLATEDTLATLAATPTTIYIGNDRSGQACFNYIPRLAVFNSALSDANLQSVTT